MASEYAARGCAALARQIELFSPRSPDGGSWAQVARAVWGGAPEVIQADSSCRSPISSEGGEVARCAVVPGLSYRPQAIFRPTRRFIAGETYCALLAHLIQCARAAEREEENKMQTCCGWIQRHTEQCGQSQEPCQSVAQGRTKLQSMEATYASRDGCIARHYPEAGS